MQYDAETSVRKIGNSDYEGQVDGHWNIGDNPNGGYLVSIAINAIANELPHPDPVSVTTHYLRPGTAGAPCQVSVDVIRKGRTLSSAKATLSQDGKEKLVVMAAFADLNETVGVDTELTLTAPAIAPIGDCVPRTGSAQGVALPLASRVNTLLDPEFAVPGKSAVAEMAGWITFTDERDPDPRSLILFTDAFPPSPLSKLGAIGWVPTLELTVHILSKPSSGPVQAYFKTDSLKQGRMIETGSLWDATGQLVATSRQLGLVMRQV